MQAVLHPLSECVMCASASCCLAAVRARRVLLSFLSDEHSH